MSNDINNYDSSDNSEDSELYVLEQKIRALQNNRRTLLRQKYDYEKNLSEFQKELKKLKKSPLIIGTVEEVFPEEELAVIRSSSGPSFMVSFASDIETLKLRAGATVALNQRTFSVIKVLSETQDPFVTQLQVDEKPNIDFKKIGGLDEQITELKEAIELPFTHPELFEEVGIDPPKGVLLYGPPGTGKTLLAKAVANHTKATFINLVGSNLVQKYIGEGTRLVKELFDYAKKKAPAIIFIDELDAIGSKREVTTSGDLEVQRTLMELLAQMDGFKLNSNIKVIGATNRPDILDPALIRPGRFDRHIEIPMPNIEARKSIFEIYLSEMSVKYSDNDLEIFAELTETMTGATIKSICTEAGMNVIRRNEDTILSSDIINAINSVQQSKFLSQNQASFTYT